MNLAMAGFINQSGPKAPFAPEGQGGQHRDAGAYDGKQINV
jgi:hypothetical protein